MRKKRIFGPRPQSGKFSLFMFAVLVLTLSAASFSAGVQVGRSSPDARDSSYQSVHR